LQGSSNVSADDVVGTVQFWWHAVVMIGKAYSDSAYAGLGYQLRERQVPFWVGVPLRKYHDGTTFSVLLGGRKVSRMNDVVLRVGSGKGTRKCK